MMTEKQIAEGCELFGITEELVDGVPRSPEQVARRLARKNREIGRRYAKTGNKPCSPRETARRMKQAMKERARQHLAQVREAALAAQNNA